MLSGACCRLSSALRIFRAPWPAVCIWEAAQVTRAAASWSGAGGPRDFPQPRGAFALSPVLRAAFSGPPAGPGLTHSPPESGDREPVSPTEPHSRPVVPEDCKARKKIQLFQASSLPQFILSFPPLRYEPSTHELINEELGIAYPVIDGVPNMIPQAARRTQKSEKQEEMQQH
ncbi:protein preY, mitochondrial [Carlito syrichta]|uniref:Protein preY, mitochondrial n=1 Tax=Carlito syrichta TaxID=1868482 RepID=A0A3Q0DYN8_CARSF|nr:protein preY, mitochondrial [Carlito syrichta]